MNDTFAIRFEIRGNAIRYAQNRSATFDASPFVYTLDKAKRFSSIAKAEQWLRRAGLYYPAGDFIQGWEIQSVERLANHERGGTWALPGFVVATFIR